MANYPVVQDANNDIGLVAGQFTDQLQNPNDPPSVIPAAWANMLTEEILAVIAAASITPDEADTVQLRNAINQLISQAVSNEAQARSGADNTEAQARASADTALNDLISQEAADRAQADTALSGLISQEATDRANAIANAFSISNGGGTSGYIIFNAQAATSTRFMLCWGTAGTSFNISDWINFPLTFADVASVQLTQSSNSRTYENLRVTTLENSRFSARNAGLGRRESLNYIAWGLV